MKKIFIALLVSLCFSAKSATLGFLPTGTSTFIKVCEGAYISSNEYLTAAHCLAILNAIYFESEIIPAIEDGGQTYSILDFNISSKFRTRLDDNIHDDIAIAVTNSKQGREFFAISSDPLLSPEIVLSTPHFNSESGKVLTNRDGAIYGVLSRKNVSGGSIYSQINLEVLSDLRTSM